VAVKRLLALLARLVHVGVDPARPRQETKHIVLTNAFASIFAANMALATVAGSGPPFARVIAGTGAVVVSATVLLNRFGMPFAASAWLLASSTAIMVLVGLLEPEAAELLALHDADVVHRDLKPANVLLAGTEGALVAKISDFGISRFGPPTLGGPIDPKAATLEASASPVTSHLTSTGAMLGTPLYMAPEAARGGRSIEASADVFAFGILAYEAITGRFPFAMPPVLLALAGQALPLVAPMGAVGIEGGVRDCVLACLSEDAAARPSARSLRDALGA
jgi:serine/threonine protein kinase